MQTVADFSVDEEAVRLTAYYLWEQEGRPESDPREFWRRAVDLHRQAQARGTQIEAGLEAIEEPPSPPS
jgi:hypothetical protein